MKKTFVMAAAMLLSLATIAQPGTRKATKNKMSKDSMQMMNKDSMYMSGDSTNNGKYRMKKNKMKSKNKMTKDSTTTS